jgi:hypothetical protein
MKRLVVRLEYELELSDYARPEDPLDDDVEMLILHGCYLEPTISCLQLEHIDPTASFIQAAVSGELEEELNDAIVAGDVPPMELRDAPAERMNEGQRYSWREGANGS